MAAEPKLLLADEPTTALDVTTQAEVMAIIDEARAERGLAMLFITHDLELASAVCDRIAVMYAGSVVEHLPAGALHSRSAHPCTRALLASRPTIGERGGPLRAIPGRPLSAFEAGGSDGGRGRGPDHDEVLQRVVDEPVPAVVGPVLLDDPGNILAVEAAPLLQRRVDEGAEEPHGLAVGVESVLQVGYAPGAAARRDRQDGSSMSTTVTPSGLGWSRSIGVKA
ncbi:hypothetical protein [Streptomyces sp. NBC_00842]|uniref:hypothetical protein n=1 Tax=unclassified Streptomyces TaxID=2593676 RepID=UPI00386EC0D8